MSLHADLLDQAEQLVGPAGSDRVISYFWSFARSER
jgi:hypothetical protein